MDLDLNSVLGRVRSTG